MAIHPTAIVDSDALIGSGVSIGPFSIIGAGVTIGADTEIGPHCTIEGDVTIGERNRITGHTSIGNPPQDLKYKGEKTRVVIGHDNVMREFCTVHRGTVTGRGVTEIRDHNYVMAYSHIAHDCVVGSHVIFANAGTLAGHVDIGDYATVGAFTTVHQFCRVGEHAFLGGCTVVTQDALPYVKTVGARPAKTYGVNTIGLERKGFNPETIEALRRAYKILTRSKMLLHDALEKIEQDLGHFAEARYFVEFIRGSKRGIVR